MSETTEQYRARRLAYERKTGTHPSDQTWDYLNEQFSAETLSEPTEKVEAVHMAFEDGWDQGWHDCVTEWEER